MTRRRFLKFAGTGIAIGGGLLGWATLIEPHWVEVTYRSLPLPNLPPSLHGKRLIQLSDFHIGRTDVDYLRSIIKLVNELRADFNVLTGDFIDHGFPNVVDQIRAVFSELQPAAIANIGCMGNHDYGHDWKQVDVADRYVSGFYDVGPQRTLYINRGVGHGLKARFNCRPEITVFSLEKA
jgi:uncharacterized protein